MTGRKLALRYGAVVAVLVLGLAGCRAVGSVPDGTEPPLTGKETNPPLETFLKTPGATPVPREEDDCLDIRVTTDTYPFTIDSISRVSSAIVRGTFEGYGEAVWNTPDGHRPTTTELRDKARLVRPVQIDVTSAVRGRPEEASNVMERGGTKGCDSITYGDVEIIERGSENVFFFTPVQDSTGRTGRYLGLVEAWAIDADGNVNTPQEGSLPVKQVLSMIDAVPYQEEPAASKW